MAGVVTGWMNKGIGAAQYQKGIKAERELGDRPTYQMPEGFLESLSIAERQAFEGLPAEQQQQFIENMLAMQQTGLGQLADRKAGLTGVSQMSQTATQGYRDLLSMDVQARQRNTDAYRQALEKKGDYQDIEYQQNVLYPYQEDLAYARALQGAGIQNTQTGMEQDEAAFRDVFGTVMGGGGLV